MATRFVGELVMRAELMHRGQTAIHCCHFIECGRGRCRAFKGRGVENIGLGIKEGALHDGTVVPHTMSTQRNWEKEKKKKKHKSQRTSRGTKVVRRISTNRWV